MGAKRISVMLEPLLHRLNQVWRADCKKSAIFWTCCRALTGGEKKLTCQISCWLLLTTVLNDLAFCIRDPKSVVATKIIFMSSSKTAASRVVHGSKKKNC